jgi:phosphoglycolate phosphatase-like HAD superfamily hydrolase
MHPRLILFDIDGTLVLTQGAGREATRLAMLDIFGTSAGIESHHFGGKTDWQTLVELLTPLGLTYTDVQRAMPEYNRVMGAHLERIIGAYTVTPCVGTLELVAYLHAHSAALLGLVTGNVSKAAPVKLRAAGFEMAHFPVGAYGDEAMSRDDLPILALTRAQRHYGHPIQPEQVVVVGDTPADIQCARALGAVAVGVLTGFSSREAMEATQPDLLLDDLTGFAAALDL